jgi:hypothetical protein
LPAVPERDAGQGHEPRAHVILPAAADHGAYAQKEDCERKRPRRHVGEEKLVISGLVNKLHE